MAQIPLVDPSQAPGPAAQVFQEIQKTLGRVPNLFRAYANKPELLRANWEKHKAVMGPGTLPQQLKEGIALAVSQANGCQYCIKAHSAVLKMIGADEPRIQGLRQRKVADPKEKAILDFAVQFSRDPHAAQGQVKRLKELGLTEFEVTEAAGVAEHITGYNKFLDTFGVEIDF